MRIVTWNSGGLNLSRQAELKAWLEQESRTDPVHILCVQETHWPTTCEYRDGPWTCIHSGSGTREGGVLVMLHTSYFQGVDTKHAEIKAGRLLHARICSNPAIDLLCVYQHAWNPAKAEHQNQPLSAEQLLINKRQEIWQHMQGWIAGIAKRNSLVILGDFNATLTPLHPHVGKGVGHEHVHKKDGHAFQSLIQTAGLNAVNTWRKRGLPASTFWTHRGEGSQIDYIIIRNPCAISQLRLIKAQHIATCLNSASNRLQTCPGAMLLAVAKASAHCLLQSINSASGSTCMQLMPAPAGTVPRQTPAPGLYS